MKQPTSRLSLLNDRWQIHSIRDSADTIDIRYGVYRNDPEPLSYVVFLNGRTEWIEKYDYLPEDLNLSKSIGFLTMDHRGQGGSGGARSYVASYDNFASDCKRVVDHVVGGKPYVLVGHSMGGLIGLYSVLNHYLKPRSMVLCSPLLGMPNQPVPRNMARPLSRLMSTARLGPVSTGAGKYVFAPFEENRLTHDYDRYRRMQEGPYRPTGVTFGWVNATFAAIQTVFDERKLAKLAVPTLVLGGTEETVVDGDAFGIWVRDADRVSKTEVNLQLFPEARHELLSEVPNIYQSVVRATRHWIEPGLNLN